MADGDAVPMESNAARSEVEVKFKLEKAALDEVLKSPLFKAAKVSAAKDITSIYFDTTDNELRKCGIALRVRKRGKSAPLLGVKWAGQVEDGPFSRGEVEVPCTATEPDLEVFDPETKGRIQGAIGNNQLEARFETRVKRRLASLRHGHSDIEIAVDDGVISSNGAQLPLIELELELKSGNLPDLLNCASIFARDLPLRLDFEAKADRGYRIALGTLASPQKASPLKIAMTATVDDVVVAVVSSSLSHFVANWASLRESDDPEAIHQLRVALRRMRSGLGVFKKVVTLPELEDIRNEAKRIASALGPARECDAFLENARKGPLKELMPPPRGASELLNAVEARRVANYVEARRLIEDVDSTLFVLKVQSFVARRAWRNAVSPGCLSLLTSSGRGFAERALNRLQQKVLNRGKNLPDVPDEERHELRIALKNLRYAAEFFGNMFDTRKDQRAFLRQVSELQDILGAHNDAATAQIFIEKLQLEPTANSHFASGFVLGWYQNATALADAHLLKRWKRFKHVQPFWK